MTLPPRFGLSDAEKDALLLEQAEMIQRLATRIAELEAILGKPRKTSSNSHTPPSQDGPGRAKRPKRPARKRPSRAGSCRPLTELPDKTERRMASACGHCGADVSAATRGVAIATITSICRQSGPWSPEWRSSAGGAGAVAIDIVPRRRPACRRARPLAQASARC